MPSITPCLWFDTEGEDAANLYTSVFPNSRIVEIARYGSAGPRPEGAVMTVSFELDGKPFLALNGGPEVTVSEALSFHGDWARPAQGDHYSEKVSGGGERGPRGWLQGMFCRSLPIV